MERAASVIYWRREFKIHDVIIVPVYPVNPVKKIMILRLLREHTGATDLIFMK